MIGRGLEQAVRTAYPDYLIQGGQNDQAQALRKLYSTLPRRYDEDFWDPHEGSVDEVNEGPMIKAGLDKIERLGLVEEGSEQAAEVAVFRATYDLFVARGFRDPLPLIRKADINGKEVPVRSELIRVPKLNDLDLKVIASSIGAELSPVENPKRHFMYPQLDERAVLMQRSTGARLLVSNGYIKVELPDLGRSRSVDPWEDPRRYSDHTVMVEKGYDSVTFWGRGFLSRGGYPEWLSETRFTHEGYTPTKVVDYSKAHPALVTAFGPFDRA